MRTMLRSIRVLFWKNWRIKQRESRLNRNRTGKQCLFPALLTDIVLPLTLLLLLIQKCCEYNTSIGIPPTPPQQLTLAADISDINLQIGESNSGDGDGSMNALLSTDVLTLEARRRMMLVNPSLEDLKTVTDAAVENFPRRHTTARTTLSPSLFMAALPLLLKISNQSLAILDRKETREFLAYLDREYPAAEELGMPSFTQMTKIIPLYNATPSEKQANTIIASYPKRSGFDIYAGLDIRRSDESTSKSQDLHPLELLTYLYEEPDHDSQVVSSKDQLMKYYAQSLNFDDRSLRFPGILPFQLEMDMFLRQNASTTTAEDVSEIVLPSPSTVCRAISDMLKTGSLWWRDLPSTSPLGQSTKACESAITKGGFSDKVLLFLSNIVDKAVAKDELRNLNVLALPNRPQSTVSGQLENSIIFCVAYLFLWPYTRLVRDIVMEKEKQLKEYLLIMGLEPMALLISWFLLYFVASAVVSAIAVGLLSGTMFVATQASSLYFFILLIVFIISMLLFAVAITPIFSQTKTAAACAPLVYFILSIGPFLRSAIGEDTMATSSLLNIIVTSLEHISSPVVFMAALHDVLALDAVTSAIRPIGWVTIEHACIKMLIQSIGYLALGWYLENVFPRTYGVQQRWYFVFVPSYWFPYWFGKVSSTLSDDESMERMGLTQSEQEQPDEEHDETLREIPLSEYLQHFKPILFVKSLSKRYPNGKEALKNVSFGVKKGEIFGLLGPNGAGKSTTLSILCGMLSPTTGDAFVGGALSVSKDPQAIRKSLSVCFQQNILFDELTVWEHLSLVCALKTTLGIKTIAEETWINKLRQFGLEEKKDALSKTLSGGQKRKLSLVLALLDTSRVVLLDEPTAGMDLKARLDTWDALKRAVSHRAVILTTHSMQEAQALCENIGIVADGRLKCCGSSLFLRERFGVGYKLTIVRHDDFVVDDQNEENKSQKQEQTRVLMQTVQKHVPNASVVSDNKWEMRVQLSDGQEACFVHLFEDLESMKQRNEIKRYAIAATDLEDVFVKVTEGEDVYYNTKASSPENDSEKVQPFSKEIQLASPSDDRNFDRSIRKDLTVPQRALSQIRALFIKRTKVTIRDKRALFAQYVWPIALFALLLALIQHLSTAGQVIETVTSLPPSASKASLFIASKPNLADSVHPIVAQFRNTRHAVVYNTAENEKEMLDIMYNTTATSFFTGVFISDVNWTQTSLDGMKYSLYYNQSITHSLPVTLELMSEAYCKVLASKKSDQHLIEQCDLIVQRGVFPYDIPAVHSDNADEIEYNSQSPTINSDDVENVVRRILVGYYLLVTMSSIVSYYISPIVKEKESGLKRLQFLHLASKNASLHYWISNLLFDLFGYIIAISGILVIMVVFPASLSVDIVSAWLVSMLLFGLAVLPFLYCSSLAFASHSSAQSVMSYVSFFQILAVSILWGMSMIPGLCAKADSVSNILQVFPLFAFGTAVINVATLSWMPVRNLCVTFASSGSPDGLDQDLGTLMMNAANLDQSDSSVWDWEVTGKSYVALLLSAVGYWILLLVFDQKQMYPTLVAHRIERALLWLKSVCCCGSRGGYTPTERVVHDDLENPVKDIVQVIDISKVYNPKKRTQTPTEGSDVTDNEPAVLNQNGQVLALDNVSFSVEKNDCVALLGVNGSGKSTMFEILTGGIAPTSGKALIDSVDVTLEPQEASVKYGYCPQTNIFFNDMNVHEHLELFYRLRRIQSTSHQEEKAVIDALMARLDLFPVAKTAASHLSGGNKRRLMLALSLLSDQTSLLLFDEPSAGVDVVARRLMWRILDEKRQSSQRTSCLFTTHSMEEAEAVCANAVVLYKGKRVWSGSIPDLKQHATRGISISIRLDSLVIWNPQHVQLYTQLVIRMLEQNQSSSAAVENRRIQSSELENAWKVCCKHHHQDSNDTHPTEQSKRWFTGLLARLEQDDNAYDDQDTRSMDVMEFVKEWLVHEAFQRLETDLFAGEITSRSGEPVKSVELQNARGSGSNTNGVYETNCNDHFGLADAFAIMETNKAAFSISQYSISELSLERVFEQFT